MTTFPNWVDLFVLIIIIRACYVGFEYGLVTALLQLISAVSATAMSVNFGPAVWVLIKSGFPLKKVGAFVIFWVLFAMVGLLFSLIARRIANLIKWERLNVLLQAGGLICGFLRGSLWSMVLITGLSLSGIPYFEESVVGRSLAGARFGETSEEALKGIAGFFPAPDGRETLALFPKVPLSEESKTKKDSKAIRKKPGPKRSPAAPR